MTILIEGTQSSLSDLLLFEAEESPGSPMDDVREVSNYVAALEHGLTRLREGFPLSLRLLREMHGKLLSSGRGAQKEPGEFRRSQNWIGGTRPGNAVAVVHTAGQAVDTVQRLSLLAREDRRRIQGLRRRSGSALRVHHELLRRPVTNARQLQHLTGLTAATVSKSLDNLCTLGVTRELTGQQRHRRFSYEAYMSILNEDAELPGSNP